MLQRIESDLFQAEINPIGAELFSLKSKQTDTEYIWQGDPAWWPDRAIILFPIACAMKDNTYTLGGKTYTMPKHGFVRGATFSVLGKGSSKVVLEYSDNEETRRMYPFSFTFQVVFELVSNTLSTTYRVINRGKDAMYFSVGAHEGYCCPREDGESFEDYYLEFENNGTYNSEMITPEGLLEGGTYTVIENGKILPLKHELFVDDALIFKNVPSSKVYLKSKKTSTVVEVDYKDAPHLGIWTKVGAPYICIEPWYGLPDEAAHDGKIENKLGINKLDAGSEFEWTHAITITQ